MQKNGKPARVIQVLHLFLPRKMKQIWMHVKYLIYNVINRTVAAEAGDFWRKCSSVNNLSQV